MANPLIRYTFSIVITFVLLSLLRPDNSGSAQHQVEPVEPIDTTSLLSVGETWSDHLIRPSDEIPIDSYLAIYFRTSQPDTIVYRENVPKAVINYPWSDFQNINSDEFGGYWVGDFDFEEEEVRSFHISQGHAKSRILVNRRVIYEGSGSRVIPVKFTAGRHRIEIQYVNHWHTVDYSVKLLPQNLYDGPPPPNPTQSSTIWYAGIYESSNRNAEVTVRLKPAPTPIHLYLASYSAVTWNIEQTSEAELAGVYFSSYSPGTEVQFSAQAIPVQEISLPYIYSLEPNCSEHGAIVHCDTPPLFRR